MSYGAVAVGLISLWLPHLAQAHLVSTRFGELYSGLLHPLTTILHLLPWVALGLLCGLQKSQQARVVLWLFPLAVLGGLATAGRFEWIEFATLELLCILSFVVLGLACAVRLELSNGTLFGLVVAVGFLHGAANSAIGLSAQATFLYSIGVALTAYLVTALTSAPALSLANTAGWGHIAVRAGGSWIGAIGLIYLVFNLLPSL